MRPVFYQSPTRFIRHFRREEDGAVTVEAVLWIPFFFAVLILICDASFAFYSKAQAFRLMQNGNRAFAVRRLESIDKTEEWIEAAIAPLSPNAEVTTSVSSGVVSTTVVMPASDVLMFNTLAALSNFDITVRAQHYLE